MVSISTEDGGVVYATLSGSGDHAVILTHGGQFTKESWAAQVRALADSGFITLAIDFRAHAQHVFATDQGEGLLAEIIEFLEKAED
jgi:alpha-beta hydrolase superfamily lysophospholipase